MSFTLHCRKFGVVKITHSQKIWSCKKMTFCKSALGYWLTEVTGTSAKGRDYKRSFVQLHWVEMIGGRRAVTRAFA